MNDDQQRTAIKRTADGEFEYEPTAPYVLSQPDDDWCYAIVRTEDGEVLGTDGWQQMGVVEDATFTRDLRWIIPELNRQAEEIKRLRDLLNSAADALAEFYDDDVYTEEGLIQLIEEAVGGNGSSSEGQQ